MARSETAFCGIGCGSCNLRLAHKNREAAQALVGWFRQRGWIQPHEGAAEIMEKAPFCTGCRCEDEPHFGQTCHMRLCCGTKGFDHCGQCPDFPCTPYMEWTADTPHHQAAMERLISLKSGSCE